MTKPQHWAVTVAVDGENVLTIDRNCLCGVEDIDDHAETIETAARHLLAFIGAPLPSHKRGDPAPALYRGTSQ